MARSVLKNYRLTPRDIADLEHIRLELEANPPPGLGKVTEAAALRFAIATTRSITGTATGTINPLVGAATGTHVPFIGTKTPPAEAEPPKPARRVRQPKKVG